MLSSPRSGERTTVLLDEPHLLSLLHGFDGFSPLLVAVVSIYGITIINDEC